MMKFAYCVAIAIQFGISGSMRKEYRMIAETDDEAIEEAKARASEQFLDADIEVIDIFKGANPL